jgi:hypothetical protein
MERRSYLLMRPAIFEPSELRELFATGAGLARWLASEAVIGGVGDPCALRLRDRGTLSGRVLAVSNWEVALSWSETGGVLELKGFPLPSGERVVALRGTFWGRPAEEVATLEGRLRPAVERLAALARTG